MKYSFKKRLKHTWLKFRPLIVVYISFLLIWLYLVFFYNWEFTGNGPHYKGFLKSWFPSFTEDMLFFGLAFISLLITTKLLRDEPFEIRISSLANGKNMSKTVDRFLRQQVENLLSYNIKTDLNVTIKKIDLEKNLIFVHVAYVTRIVNMCEGQNIPSRIQIGVYPGGNIGDDYGYVSLFNVIPGNDDDQKQKKSKSVPVHIIKPGEFLYLNTLKGDPYKEKLKYDIDDDGYVTVNLSFGIWNSINGDDKVEKNWVNWEFSGYTENCDIFVDNKVDLDIDFKYKFVNRLQEGESSQIKEVPNNFLKAYRKVEADNKELKPLVSDLRFLKNDKFQFFFTLKTGGYHENT